jgi:hypothetical protein
MNWALPLLFILLSPGFLLSLGSKCKISIMTILIHALIFTIIINVYEPEIEGFQTSGSSPSGTTVTNSPTSTTISNQNALITVSAPSGSTVNTVVPPEWTMAMSIPNIANDFYTASLARDPSTASNTRLLPNDPTRASPSGSGPTQYQKNTLLLTYVAGAFYPNNLKDLCNMKDPTGTSMPWVPVPPLCPTPPACPECKPAPAAPSFACTIM